MPRIAGVDIPDGKKVRYALRYVQGLGPKSVDDILAEADCINLLRVQFERQRGAFFPSVREYAHLFGMNGDRIRRARKDVLILAPGPINRGVELTPEVADGEHSVILDQVTNGLVIRMACLHLLHQARQTN